MSVRLPEKESRTTTEMESHTIVCSDHQTAPSSREGPAEEAGREEGQTTFGSAIRGAREALNNEW